MTTPVPDPAQPQGDAGVAQLRGAATSVPRHTRRNLLWGGALGGLLLVGGGTAVAVTMLGGGGAQPDSVLPGNAIAYVRMDIDPSVTTPQCWQGHLSPGRPFSNRDMSIGCFTYRKSTVS